MTLTTGVLHARASEIESASARISILNIIYTAWENANDTHGNKEVSEGEYEETAWRTLEMLLCYEGSEEIKAWFKVQGVRW